MEKLKQYKKREYLHQLQEFGKNFKFSHVIVFRELLAIHDWHYQAI